MTPPQRVQTRKRKELGVVLLGWAIAVILSAIEPKDGFTWFLEAAPVLIAAPVLWITRDRFPLTSLAYVLVFVHGLILLIGAHYTYAEVPWGDWVRDTMNLSRNPYDRVGHFAQGFVPAIVAREIITRRLPSVPTPWRVFFVTCFCLALSALYELIEWWAALLTGEAAHAFLGTQGDIWDTQWDMALALAGALVAQVFLAWVHDRQMAALQREPGTVGQTVV